MVDAPAPARIPGMLLPLTVAGAFFMDGLDSTIVVTALPQMARAFGVTAAAVSGAITAYLLSVAVFIPLTGWLADRYEARRIYCAAIIVFALGSAACGLSVGVTSLVAGRALQGIGGALMTPVGRLILARSFPKDRLVHAMSFMVIPGLVGPMLGPVVGGFIATYSSWRWIFFINLPLAVVGLALAMRYIGRIESPRPAAFDFRGFFLAGAGFGALQAGLELASNKAHSQRSIALFATSAALFVIYYLHAQRRQVAVIDLRMLRLKVLSIAVLGGSFARMGIASLAFLVPILLQVGFGMSAFHAGALLFSLAAGQIAVRFGIAPLLRRHTVRAILVSAAIVISLMLCACIALRPGVPDALVMAGLFAFGMVQSVTLSTLAALSFAEVPAEAMGRATTVAAVVQRFSMASGIALSAFILERARPDGHFAPADFTYPFLAMALLQLLSLPLFMRLAPEDGSELTARGAARSPARPS